MALNQRVIDGKILRASLGTTKYCSCFLQNKPCQKTCLLFGDHLRTSNNSILQQRGDVFPCTSNELSNFGQKTSRDGSITPQSLTTTVCEQQMATIANPLPVSPVSNADFAKNYRANIAPRHYKKLDATIKSAVLELDLCNWQHKC
uniref:Uncharacterized protein n=1 Tax=Romanomermis culicivorax TaxID=13658 RepID=A0A915KHP0_ROMCU